MVVVARLSKISPLKDPPLHNPGQSLDARLDELRDRKILLPIITAVFLILLAGLEWLRWYSDTLPQPRVYSFLAIGYAIYVASTIRRSWAHLQAIKLGRDGERAVGQYLEQLRESASSVFHDITGHGFNLDHVVVAAQGIFVVETKTWRKPTRGDAHITFDGSSIRAGGYTPERDPIQQVLAQANWLRDLLKESTGKVFPVKPVIVFPGWFVESAATAEAKKRGLWLLNPKALPSFISAEPLQCEIGDLKLAAYHLSRFIRTTP